MVSSALECLLSILYDILCFVDWGLLFLFLFLLFFLLLLRLLRLHCSFFFYCSCSCFCFCSRSYCSAHILANTCSPASTPAPASASPSSPSLALPAITPTPGFMLLPCSGSYSCYCSYSSSYSKFHSVPKDFKFSMDLVHKIIKIAVKKPAWSGWRFSC